MKGKKLRPRFELSLQIPFLLKIENYAKHTFISFFNYVSTQPLFHEQDVKHGQFLSRV